MVASRRVVSILSDSISPEPEISRLSKIVNAHGKNESGVVNQVEPLFETELKRPAYHFCFDMFHNIVVSFNGKGLAPALRYDHLARSAQVDAVKIADLPRLGD